MSPEKFEQRLTTLNELGCNAKMALFAYSEENQQMAIFFPNEDGDSVMDITSKLATLFKTLLAATEKQDDKRQFEVLRNAMASAILPYINGLDEEELAAAFALGL